MKRYEIKDTHNPTWKGQRFTSLDRAEREFAHTVGEPGRWELWDRDLPKADNPLKVR